MRFLALQAVGCALATLMASAAPPLNSKEEAAGRKLYLGKCAKCHKLYNPAGYSEARWDLWMGKMSRKAKLSPDEERLLTAYIAQSLRSREPGHPSSPSR